MLLIPNVIIPDVKRDSQSGYDGVRTQATLTTTRLSGMLDENFAWGVQAGGHCSYAARTKGGASHGCEFFLQPDATHAHFSYLTANIEQMMLTGKAGYDAKRTLLTTGIFDYVMRARSQGTGEVWETPDLEISYASYGDDAVPARPSAPRPQGASNDILNPDDNWTQGGGRWTQH